MYAKWTLHNYSITYIDPRNVINPNVISFTINDTVILTDLTCDYYDFLGWFDASSDGSRHYGWPGNQKKFDVTMWARWKPHEYSITYNNLDGATNPNVEKFTVEDKVRLSSVIHNGAMCEWYDTSSCENKITGWNEGEKTSNVDVWGKWFDNYIEDQSGDFVINRTRIYNSSLVQVISEPVVINGSDDNWNHYCESNVVDSQKGVFVSGRNVELSPYKIGQYLVTQKLYLSLCNKCSEISYDKGTGDNYPIYYINWYEAITFCNKLSIKMGKTPCYSVVGVTDWENYSCDSIPTSKNDNWNNAQCDFSADGYRLPTEAEWEFATRGGNQNEVDWYYPFSGIQNMNPLYRNSTSPSNRLYGGIYNNLYIDENLDLVGWYIENSENKIHPVGQKYGNRLGLFDMSGNLWELC